MQNLPLAREGKAAPPVADSICLLTVPSGFLVQSGPLVQRFTTTRGSVRQEAK